MPDSRPVAENLYGCYNLHNRMFRLPQPCTTALVSTGEKLVVVLVRRAELQPPAGAWPAGTWSAGRLVRIGTVALAYQTPSSRLSVRHLPVRAHRTVASKREAFPSKNAVSATE